MANIFKINDIEYLCEFKLTNIDGKEIQFTKSAIRGMTIIDNIFEPFMGGSISIANPYDFIENELFIRGDGTDELHIYFKPKESKGFLDEGFDKTFVIIEDADMVNPEVRSENIKIFSLLSKDAIPFSDKVPYNKKYSGKVGDIIKKVFEEVGVPTGEWTSGDFELTFIPPATFRYMDTLRYLLRIFYAKVEGIHVKGFIDFNKKTKVYDFKLISDIFKNNKDLTMEAFLIGDLTSDVLFNNPNNPVSGPKVGEDIGQLKNLGYSTPMYSWSTDYFLNSLVIGYDGKMGEMKMEKIKFEEFKNSWSNVFVSPFQAIGGNVKPFVIEKSKDIFKRYKFPYQVEDGIGIVESEMANALVFYNLQLSFSNIGSTSRTSNKFIDIVSPRSSKPSDGKTPRESMKSEEKTLGRWYVTEMHHIFTGDIYTNNIFATKTYIGPTSTIS